MKNLRALTRTVMGMAFIPVVAVLAALQGLVVGPLTRNDTLIPGLIYSGLRRIFGYKVVFNKASAPVVKNKPVWFLANHMSGTDFITAGSVLNGSFIGKGELLKRPGVAQIARAMKFIGIERKSAFNAQARGKIAKNFNAGYNTIMFPEATTTDGNEVKLFHAGLLTLLFGAASVDEKNRAVPLEKDVVIQPVAIQVKSVNGRDAAEDRSLRDFYRMNNGGKTLSNVWKSLQVKNITLEVTAFAPLDPRDFKSAEDLANAAALSVASVVNPGQTTFRKAVIPGRKAA
ncbi:MAG: 1-acyl-sn-glycerol-3-phosphate acyltransferase [Alphaproteobacteria bacterium]|nr:1-acyl-sn-glycerol-3-phosphate acyltransferase [Alphaproteobacteria bacterium]MDE2335892.1 1-acyl-sn-glycerol-3-phosphate acyltransferase [Alphaproteobacteria bacterium]